MQKPCQKKTQLCFYTWAKKLNNELMPKIAQIETVSFFVR
jgi:hypothetical protein